MKSAIFLCCIALAFAKKKPRFYTSNGSSRGSSTEDDTYYYVQAEPKAQVQKLLQDLKTYNPRTGINFPRYKNLALYRTKLAPYFAEELRHKQVDYFALSDEAKTRLHQFPLFHNEKTRKYVSSHIPRTVTWKSKDLYFEWVHEILAPFNIAVPAPLGEGEGDVDQEHTHIIDQVAGDDNDNDDAENNEDKELEVNSWFVNEDEIVERKKKVSSMQENLMKNIRELEEIRHASQDGLKILEDGKSFIQEILNSGYQTVKLDLMKLYIEELSQIHLNLERNISIVDSEYGQAQAKLETMNKTLMGSLDDASLKDMENDLELIQNNLGKYEKEKFMASLMHMRMIVEVHKIKSLRTELFEMVTKTMAQETLAAKVRGRINDIRRTLSSEKENLKVNPESERIVKEMVDFQHKVMRHQFSTERFKLINDIILKAQLLFDELSFNVQNLQITWNDDERYLLEFDKELNCNNADVINDKVDKIQSELEQAWKNFKNGDRNLELLIEKTVPTLRTLIKEQNREDTLKQISELFKSFQSQKKHIDNIFEQPKSWDEFRKKHILGDEHISTLNPQFRFYPNVFGLLDAQKNYRKLTEILSELEKNSNMVRAKSISMQKKVEDSLTFLNELYLICTQDNNDYPRQVNFIEVQEKDLKYLQHEHDTIQQEYNEILKIWRNSADLMGQGSSYHINVANFISRKVLSMSKANLDQQ